MAVRFSGLSTNVLLDLTSNGSRLGQKQSKEWIYRSRVVLGILTVAGALIIMEIIILLLHIGL